MSGKISCYCCSKQYDKHRVLSCVICGNSFGGACVDMGTSEIRIVNSKKSVAWNCPKCQNIGGDVASLRSVISSLQTEIQHLKVSIQSLSSQPQDNVNDEKFEEILLEIEERQKRRNNLIIHGLPEQTDGSNDDIITKDCESVNEMLRSALPSCPTLGPSEIRRLGKRSIGNDKPRPLKLTMNSSQLVYKVLGKSKVFKEEFGVFISSDRTPRQRDYFNKIKAELEQRRSAGESVELKYMRGIPVIKHLNSIPPVAN